MPSTDLDIVTIGRVSIDLYAEQPGPMESVTSLRKSVGGTATNVAVAASRLGHRSAVVTKVGEDIFGRDILHALSERFDVDCSYVSKHPHLPTPLAFAELDPAEDPNLIFYRYPNAPDFELSPDDLRPVPIEDVAILWIPATRFAVEPSRGTVVEVLGRRKRRRHTIIDLDWRPQFWESEAHGRAAVEKLIAQFSIAIGNRDECRVVVGTADPAVAADRLLDNGLDAAVIKLGAEGVLVALPDGTRRLVEPFDIDVVCGLGAGDAFGGAFCHGLLLGWPITDCVRYANAAGAIVASRLLCADDMPYAHEVDAFLREREAQETT